MRVQRHRSTPPRPLGLVLVLTVAAITGAACSGAASVARPAVTPIVPASDATNAGGIDPANPWLSGEGLERAIAFRKGAGLRTDDAWLRFVANNPNALDNVQRYSVPLTDGEVADLAVREDALLDLARFGTRHPDAWGGYYLDGGAIVVWLIDPTGAVEGELRTAVPRPLLVKPARWTLQELQALADRVADDPWLKANYRLLSAGADPEHNTVALEVSSADPTVPATIARHYGLGDELTVTIDGTGAADGPPNG